MTKQELMEKLDELSLFFSFLDDDYTFSILYNQFQLCTIENNSNRLVIKYTPGLHLMSEEIYKQAAKLIFDYHLSKF